MFQGRFGSVAMDEDHLLAAFRYVALNPVKAGLVSRAEDWPWSSAQAHLARTDSRLVQVQPLLDRVPDVKAYFEGASEGEDLWSDVLKSELIGRPVGAQEWIKRLEAQYAKTLSHQKRGPKPRDKVSAEQRIDDNLSLL